MEIQPAPIAILAGKSQKNARFDNFDEEKNVLLDPTYATCGGASCIAKAQLWERQEAEAEAAIEALENERLAEHLKGCQHNPQCRTIWDAEQHDADEYFESRAVEQMLDQNPKS